MVPTILGHAFVLFPTKLAAYRAFFLSAAVIHACSVCALFLVDPATERKRLMARALGDAESQGAENNITNQDLLEPLNGNADVATSGDHSGPATQVRRAPWGALLCDRLLWGGVAADQNSAKKRLQ